MTKITREQSCLQCGRYAFIPIIQTDSEAAQHSGRYEEEKALHLFYKEPTYLPAYIVIIILHPHFVFSTGSGVYSGRDP